MKTIKFLNRTAQTILVLLPYLFVLLFIFSSCDKRKDFFNEAYNASASSVNVRLLNAHSKISATIEEHTITDTVKIGFNYRFDFELVNDYPVRLRSESEGKLFIKKQDSYTSLGEHELTSGVYSFNWLPDHGEDDYTFSLIFTDIYGNETTYTFFVYAFENWIVNSSTGLDYNLVPVGNNGNLHYEIHITGDDADKLYGGQILYYEIVVDQDTTLYSDPIMSYIFPKAGTYFIGVRAMDSNNEWSGYKYKEENVATISN